MRFFLTSGIFSPPDVRICRSSRQQSLRVLHRGRGARWPRDGTRDACSFCKCFWFEIKVACFLKGVYTSTQETLPTLRRLRTNKKSPPPGSVARSVRVLKYWQFMCDVQFGYALQLQEECDRVGENRGVLRTNLVLDTLDAVLHLHVEVAKALDVLFGRLPVTSARWLPRSWRPSCGTSSGWTPSSALLHLRISHDRSCGVFVHPVVDRHQTWRTSRECC